MSAQDQTYPRIERACNIEVPRPRDGRPAYAWVQGWAVRYSESRVSTPMRRNEAREVLMAEKESLARAELVMEYYGLGDSFVWDAPTLAPYVDIYLKEHGDGAA